MKVYNKEKTMILDAYDLTKGHLKEDTIVIHRNASEGVQEKFHFEVTKEYPNGGKDVKKVIDVEGVEGHEEGDFEEKILVFIPYTAKELAEIRIAQLKKLLADSDYKAIKYAEGLISASDYASIKLEREMWRKEINEKEKDL